VWGGKEKKRKGGSSTRSTSLARRRPEPASRRSDDIPRPRCLNYGKSANECFAERGKVREGTQPRFCFSFPLLSPGSPRSCDENETKEETRWLRARARTHTQRVRGSGARRGKFLKLVDDFDILRIFPSSRAELARSECSAREPRGFLDPAVRTARSFMPTGERPGSLINKMSMNDKAGSAASCACCNARETTRDYWRNGHEQIYLTRRLPNYRVTINYRAILVAARHPAQQADIYVCIQAGSARPSRRRATLGLSRLIETGEGGSVRCAADENDRLNLALWHFAKAAHHQMEGWRGDRATALRELFSLARPVLHLCLSFPRPRGPPSVIYGPSNSTVE